MTSKQQQQQQQNENELLQTKVPTSPMRLSLAQQRSACALNEKTEMNRNIPCSTQSRYCFTYHTSLMEIERRSFPIVVLQT
jgi:hypothetical protein